MIKQGVSKGGKAFGIARINERLRRTVLISIELTGSSHFRVGSSKTLLSVDIKFVRGRLKGSNCLR